MGNLREYDVLYQPSTLIQKWHKIGQADELPSGDIIIRFDPVLASAVGLKSLMSFQLPTITLRPRVS